jgi:hypothetical protein
VVLGDERLVAHQQAALRKAAVLKPTTEMSLDELVDWARGYLLIEIGKGGYQSAVWLICQQAWQRGHIIAEEEHRASRQSTRQRREPVRLDTGH